MKSFVVGCVFRNDGEDSYLRAELLHPNTSDEQAAEMREQLPGLRSGLPI
jgi:hypothetical protein